MQNQILNDYLFKVEKALTKLSPTERAKIILEAEEQINQNIVNQPDKKIDEILKSLGEPHHFANHILIGKNLPIYRPKKEFVFLKWFTILFIGGLSVTFIAIFIMVKNFTPLIQVDDENQRVQIFGGLIDIDGKGGKVKNGAQVTFTDSQYENDFEGSINVNPEEVNEIAINFTSAKLTIDNSDSAKLSWDCKLEKVPGDDFVEEARDLVEINLNSTGGADCVFKIPEGIELTIEGEDSGISIFEPQYDLFLEIENGQVYLEPSPETLYKYQFNVTNGSTANINSSNDENAYEISIKIENGAITTP